MSKELTKYVRDCVLSGYSFPQIEEAMVNEGYSKRVAEGVILSYKHKAKMLKWIAVSSMVGMFIFSIYFLGGGIGGMAVFDYVDRYSDDISIYANSSFNYSWYSLNNGEIVSVYLTGKKVGEGDVKVFIENNDDKYLIFDSRISQISEVKGSVRYFEMVCEDSCKVKGFNSFKYNLIFEISDSSLEIESIGYDILAVDKTRGLFDLFFKS